MLTFIIPVRHQDNARDWTLLKANLSQTAASIAGQTHPGWRALVVANEGANTLREVELRFDDGYLENFSNLNFTPPADEGYRVRLHDLAPGADLTVLIRL